MRYTGLVLLIIGIGYGIYVDKTQNQVNAYFRERIKLINDKTEYFRMQYLVGIINSVTLGVGGLSFFLIDSLDNIPIIILLVNTTIFHLNNYILLRLADNFGIIEKVSWWHNIT